MNRIRPSSATSCRTADLRADNSMLEIELPEFAPELALVVACSRWPPGASEEQEVRTRVAAPIDWNLFLAWVRRNRIAPLVYRNLRLVACPLVPDAVVLQLQSESMRNARRALMQIAEAARISRLLAAGGIRSMIVKGPVLAQLVYGDPTLRESEDIDLVVDPDSVPDVNRTLASAGYHRVIPDVNISRPLLEIYQR